MSAVARKLGRQTRKKEVASHQRIYWAKNILLKALWSSIKRRKELIRWAREIILKRLEKVIAVRKLSCTAVESYVEVVEKEKRLEKVTAFQAEIARKQKEEEEKMEVVDEVRESRKEPAKARKMNFISI